MKLGKSRREAPDINLTPLIDVVFLLLIFFMIVTDMTRKEIEELERDGLPVDPMECVAKGASLKAGRIIEPRHPPVEGIPRNLTG